MFFIFQILFFKFAQNVAQGMIMYMYIVNTESISYHLRSNIIHTLTERVSERRLNVPLTTKSYRDGTWS